MKRKQLKNLENIPVKKLKFVEPSDFDINEYIDEHINKYTEKFIKKSMAEFSLLESLKIGFLAHLKNDDKETPFEYSTSGNQYQLSELQKKAVDIFKYQVQNKGYKVSIIKDAKGRYTDFTIKVE